MNTHTQARECQCPQISGSADSITDQIAQGVWDFELERTGYAPEAVSVVLNNDILVIKRHRALAPAERFLAATDDWLHGFPRDRLISPSDTIWQDIERITGREFYECTAETEHFASNIQHVFATGALVQVFRLI